MSDLEEKVIINEKKDSHLPGIGRVYDELARLESSMKPHPDDDIPTGQISSDDEEYQALIDCGADTSDLQRGLIKRKYLLEAGFVFNNMPLGPYMEKPLMAASVNGKDFSKRKLLTAEEVELIRNHQLENNDVYGLKGIELDVLRADMLGFMLSADDPRPRTFRNPVNVLRLVRYNIEEPSFKKWSNHEKWERTEEARTAKTDARLVDMHWDYLVKQAKKESGVQDNFNPYHIEMEFMQTICRDIYPWIDVNETTNPGSRRANLHIFDSRKKALDNLPSPFLDSGFRFPRSVVADGISVPVENPDVTVNLIDGSVFRVNMLSFHLLSRGLSEMGASERSYDQDYTAGKFVFNLFQGNDPATRTLDNRMFHARLEFDEDKLIVKLRRRLIDEAKKWANSQDAPGEAKKLAEISEGKKTDSPIKNFFKRLKS